jgi:hypothetical protein
MNKETKDEIKMCFSFIQILIHRERGGVIEKMGGTNESNWDRHRLGGKANDGDGMKLIVCFVC